MYSEENSSRPEKHLDGNLDEISCNIINNIIEEITSKRVESTEKNNDELRKITSAQSEKLKAQGNEIVILRKENGDINDILEETISENLKIKIKLNKQSKLENSFLEENESLRINITKEREESKEVNKSLIEKNYELKRKNIELKEKLSDREHEIQVVRRWRNKESEMDKSQIENLEDVLSVAKLRLHVLSQQYEDDIIEIAREKLELEKEKKYLRLEKLNVNEQVRKVLIDKDELFVEQNKLELREDLLEKEKDKIESLQDSFDKFCQKEKYKILKAKLELQGEKESFMREKALFEVRMNELESSDKFYRPILVYGLILGSLILIYRNFK